MGLKSHLQRKDNTFDSGQEMPAKSALLELPGVGEKEPCGWRKPGQEGPRLLWRKDRDQLVKVPLIQCQERNNNGRLNVW